MPLRAEKLKIPMRVFKRDLDRARMLHMFLSSSMSSLLRSIYFGLQV